MDEPEFLDEPCAIGSFAAARSSKDEEAGDLLGLRRLCVFALSHVINTMLLHACIGRIAKPGIIQNASSIFLWIRSHELLRIFEALEGDLLHLPFGRLHDGVVHTTLLVLGEVEDQVPFILFHVELGSLGMLPQLGVRQIVRSECQSVGALDHRVVLSVQVDLGVVEIPAAELGAGHCYGTAFAATEENGRLDGADEEHAILASINLDLKYGMNIKPSYCCLLTWAV